MDRIIKTAAETSLKAENAVSSLIEHKLEMEEMLKVGLDKMDN